MLNYRHLTLNVFNEKHVLISTTQVDSVEVAKIVVSFYKHLGKIEIYDEAGELVNLSNLK